MDKREEKLLGAFVKRHPDGKLLEKAQILAAKARERSANVAATLIYDALSQARSQALSEAEEIARSLPHGFGSASPIVIADLIRQHSQKGGEK